VDGRLGLFVKECARAGANAKEDVPNRWENLVERQLEAVLQSVGHSVAVTDTELDATTALQSVHTKDV
jgi:hypothetical protein